MDEESNPFKPAALSRPDALHDQQLLRDLAIVNARTTQELGPRPVGGLPVAAKRKPNLPRPMTPKRVSTSHEHEETDMNLQQIVATAVLAAGVVACEPAGRAASTTETATSAANPHPSTSSMQQTQGQPSNKLTGAQTLIRTESFPRPPYSGATYFIYERDGKIICTKLEVCNKYGECQVTYTHGPHKDREDVETGEPYGTTAPVVIEYNKLKKHVCLVNFKLIED